LETAITLKRFDVFLQTLMETLMVVPVKNLDKEGGKHQRPWQLQTSE